MMVLMVDASSYRDNKIPLGLAVKGWSVRYSELTFRTSGTL
jgi:hypothetical protein